jgi:hypothetical protein
VNGVIISGFRNVSFGPLDKLQPRRHMQSAFSLSSLLMVNLNYAASRSTIFTNLRAEVWTTWCVPKTLHARKAKLTDDQNSLFNSALKQSSSIRRDLDIFAESPSTTSPALQGTFHLISLTAVFTASKLCCRTNIGFARLVFAHDRRLLGPRKKRAHPREKRKSS